MTEFVWNARDRFGNPLTLVITAASTEEAKAILVAEGCTDLSLIQDEVMAAGISQFPKGVKMFGQEVSISAEQRVKAMGKPSKTIFTALREGIAQSKGLVLIV